ncbi:MAG: arginase family protein [Anaerolineales bacterium]
MTLTSIIGVPIDSTGTFAGCERMPAALRAAGLAERLNLPDAGDLLVSISDPERDAATGLIGFHDLVAVSAQIRGAVRDALARGERPLVVGGSCELLIGVAAALRDVVGRAATRRERNAQRFSSGSIASARAGLAFVDGHFDFYNGHTSPTGEAADTELRILTTDWPHGLADLAGTPPLLVPRDVVVIGHRDPDEAERFATEARGLGLTLHNPASLRRSGPAALGSQTEERFRRDPGRFWLHLDFDVLDERALPAVDYRMPGGLDWDELAALIKPLAHSLVLLGADITIYNPNYDPDGRHARRIVDFMAEVFVR